MNIYLTQEKQVIEFSLFSAFSQLTLDLFVANWKLLIALFFFLVLFWLVWLYCFTTGAADVGQILDNEVYKFKQGEYAGSQTQPKLSSNISFWRWIFY